MKYLEYKDYTGTIEYSNQDGLLYGKVLGIRGLVSYEGETGKDLEKDFISAIDEYISLCKAEGISIEKPFKVSFNVRIPVDLHKKAVLLAREEQISLNSFVAESIRSRLIKQAHK